MSGIGEYVQETTTGHCATLAALVIALEESGVLPKTAYGDTLKRLWQEMPEEAAIGEAGAVIERVLDLLNPPVEADIRQERPHNPPRPYLAVV